MLDAKWEARAAEISDLFYRTMWAIDPLGLEVARARHAIIALRHDFFRTLHIAPQSPEHAAALERVFEEKYALLRRALHELLAKERDKHRTENEKVRDFLVGAAKRCRRAMRLGQPEVLHFYSADDETFAGQVHPVFAVARSLWHGVREELKMAITCAVFRGAELHPDVEHMVAVMRRVVGALEMNDPRQLKYYTRSPLALSVEQEGRRLWEGARYELHKGYELLEQRRRAA